MCGIMEDFWFGTNVYSSHTIYGMTNVKTRVGCSVWYMIYDMMVVILGRNVRGLEVLRNGTPWSCLNFLRDIVFSVPCLAGVRVLAQDWRFVKGRFIEIGICMFRLALTTGIWGCDKWGWRWCGFNSKKEGEKLSCGWLLLYNLCALMT